MRLTAETVVLAPLERVWDLTEDLEGWPALTPTMTEVQRLDDGPLRPGSRARVVQPRQRPAEWEVREVEPPRSLVWGTTTAGLRLVAGHHLSEAEGGTHALLVLDVTGRGTSTLGRVAGGLLSHTLATENDGFRRAAEGLARPAYVDEHWLELPSTDPGRAWDALRRHVDSLLARTADHPLTSLLGTEPDAGFAVAAEQPPHLLSLAGRHRFSDYVLDLRVSRTGREGRGSRITAVTYADFPGLHGRAYRAALVGTRGHVLAVRRILRGIGSRA